MPVTQALGVMELQVTITSGYKEISARAGNGDILKEEDFHS
jgi:hypothetical protein